MLLAVLEFGLFDFDDNIFGRRVILLENNYIGTFNFSAKVDRVFDGYLSGLVAVIVDKFLDKKLSNDFFGL